MRNALLRITNDRTGETLGDSIREARTLRARVRGLLGRSGLGAGEGLWIEPCSSIHMFFMRFPIDAVFTDRAGRVVRVVPHLEPWRLAVGGRGARAVLELPMGTIERSATRAGDLLRISPAVDRVRGG
jgi:uncharacterized membrane protein (UPF0127 family)